MHMPVWFEQYLPAALGVVWSIVILVVGWIASKWAHKLVLRLMTIRKLDEAVARFFASLAQYGVLAVAVIASLESVGVKTTSFVAILASAGIAIGLALQGSLGNFASGVLILIFRPFRLGDMVTVAGNTGFVRDIGLFAVTIVTPDNQKVIIGNSAVTGGVIINLTAFGTRRAEIDVSIANGADVGGIVASLEAVAKTVPTVLPDPAPAVAFVGFGKGSMEFKVMAWTSCDDYLTTMHNVRAAVYQELVSSGVKTAVPFMLLQAQVDDRGPAGLPAASDPIQLSP